jgi:hypothetical protein
LHTSSISIKTTSSHAHVLHRINNWANVHSTSCAGMTRKSSGRKKDRHPAEAQVGATRQLQPFQSSVSYPAHRGQGAGGWAWLSSYGPGTTP